MIGPMNPRIAAVIAVTSLAAAVIAVAVYAAPDTRVLDARIGASPVVVELFTSQGCSKRSAGRRAAAIVHARREAARQK